MKTKMNQNQSESITRNEIKEALKRSGYLLEARASRVFSENGYDVKNSPTFEDPVTKKSREIDFMAEPLKSSKDKGFRTVVSTHFVVETINNPTPIAFFPNLSNEFDSLHDVKFTSIPPRSDFGNHFTVKLDLDKLHHSANFADCSQFCGFKRKKDGSRELMALHPDDMYETFCKLFHVVALEEKNQPPAGFFKNEELILHLTLIQPLLILQGEALIVQPKGKSMSLIKAGYVNYRFNFSHNGQDDRLFIDIITEKYLQTYLKAIKQQEVSIFRKLKRLQNEFEELRREYSMTENIESKSA